METRCEVTLSTLRPGVDIALVSLGTTPGLRRSDEAFAALVRRAGATCAIVPVRIGASGGLRRHAALTDLVFDDEVAAGQVVATQPGAGAELNRGDTVELVVSKGPDLVAVPDVSGLRAALQQRREQGPAPQFWIRSSAPLGRRRRRPRSRPVRTANRLTCR